MCCVARPALTAPDGHLELATVLRLLSLQGTFESHYVAQRYSGILSEPLTSRGVITFRPPDYLRKTTTSDSRSVTLTIDGDRVVIDSTSGHRELTTDQVPALGVLLSGLSAVAAGDAQALQRHFRAEVGGSREHWRLKLKPLDGAPEGAYGRAHSAEERMRIDYLVLSGHGGALKRIEWRTEGGDHTVLRFTGDGG